MPAAVILAFLLVPIIEIWLILQVGQVIGGWPTLGLLVAESVLGAWLVKREGRRAWHALQVAFRSARMPGQELLDAALVLVGGTLLLTPGFLTDAVGFVLILPVTRPLARRLLTRLLTRRVLRSATLRVSRGSGTTRPAGWGATVMHGDVLPGEVVADRPGSGRGVRE